MTPCPAFATPRGTAPGELDAPLRVLVAEDTLINRKVFVRMLEQIGCLADEAADGVEAVEAVRRQRYDVVFMDVMMPRLDGVEAARRIRAEIPEPELPWIIALTATTGAANLARYREAGMDVILAKPVSREDFEAVLGRSA